MPPPSKLPNFNHSQSAIRGLVGTAEALSLSQRMVAVTYHASAQPPPSLARPLPPACGADEAAWYHAEVRVDGERFATAAHPDRKLAEDLAAMEALKRFALEKEETDRRDSSDR
jgi:hypothetical protein